MRFHSVAPLAAALLWVLCATGCAGPRLESRWLDRELAIDGKDDDWAGALQPVSGEDLAVGARNDGSHLYLVLETRDPGLQAQVLRRGFTLWIDPRGGTRKQIGFRYPLNLRSEAAEGARPAGSGRRLSFDPAQHRSFELLRDGSERGERVTRDTAQGMQIAMAYADSKLVYEIALPLQDDGQATLAVGAPAGSRIGIGVESGPPEPKDDRGGPNRPQRGPGGPNGGGPPGGGFPQDWLRDPTPAGAFPVGRGSARHIEIWARLQLAAAPAVAK